jgi:hypothetical protein
MIGNGLRKMCMFGFGFGLWGKIEGAWENNGGGPGDDQMQ